MLIKEDLPTLLRPINANSGISGVGQASTRTLLIKYVADFMSIDKCSLFLHTMQPNSNQNRKVVVPDESSNLSKKNQVADMFNNIAGKYDLLNRILSVGIDKIWRKKAIASIQSCHPQRILDVATGTADLALQASTLNPQHIIGIDIADQMLAVGRTKIAKEKKSEQIQLLLGDSEAIQFEDQYFDAVTCAYGVRNFEHLEAGLKEMNRVMRIGGRLAILEFSHPQKTPIKQLYQFYFKYILPGIGKLGSKDSKAYTYLPASVQAFPEGATFCAILEEAGFKEVHAKPLSFGITTLYTATK
jgi:demethylmenaquinone methyltransferase/2-methoxy-6-polyprenyl-1,4-benzoquinol methylase